MNNDPKKLIERLQSELAENIAKAESKDEIFKYLMNYKHVLEVLFELSLNQREFLIKRMPYEVMESITRLMNLQMKVSAESEKAGPNYQSLRDLGVDVVIGDFNAGML